MTKIRVVRSVEIPDLLRISRYRKIPELGPRILFFSGGSALNGLCKTLKNYTHNSIHLVTPFDSGGSSAELRQAFNRKVGYFIGYAKSIFIQLKSKCKRLEFFIYSHDPACEI